MSLALSTYGVNNADDWPKTLPSIIEESSDRYLLIGVMTKDGNMKRHVPHTYWVSSYAQSIYHAGVIVKFIVGIVARLQREQNAVMYQQYWKHRSLRLQFIGALFFIAAIGMSQKLVGQDTPSVSVQREVKAAQILETALEAMASIEAQQSLNAAVLHGTLSLPSDPETVTGTFTARIIGKHHYLEINAGGHRTRLRFRGTAAKMERDGVTQLISVSGIADETSNLFPPLDNWADGRKSPAGIKLLPDEIVNGVDCSQLLVALPARFYVVGHRTYDIKVYVRKDTGLLRAIDYGLTQARYYNANLRGRIVYDNFKNFDGLNVPTTITKYISGVPISTFHVTDIDTTQALTEADLDF